MRKRKKKARRIGPDEILVSWANAELVEQESHLPAAYERLKRRLCPQVLDVRPALDDLEMWRWAGELLRLAWDASTQREREWHLSDLASTVHHATDTFAAPPGRAIPMEAVLAYFRRNWKTAHHCPNSDCVAPYFFARRNQKFCSSECSLPALRESKRRWWHKQKRKSKPSAVRRKKTRKEKS
jgi:hypothetical protein